MGVLYRELEDDGFGSRLCCSLSDSNSSCESARCENKVDKNQDDPFLSPDSSWNGGEKYGFLRIDRGDPGGELIGLAGSDLLLRRFDSVHGGGATANTSCGPEARPLYMRLRPDTI